MSRFEQIFDPTGNPELEQLYQDLNAKGFAMGGVPMNFFTAQSIRPDILAASWAFVQSMLIQGKLPRTVKEMIIVAISVQNNCGYCETVHAGALQMMGVPAEVVNSCVRDPLTAPIPAAHQQIINFALKINRDPCAVTAEDYELLREHGMSDEEILEVVSMASFAQFLNTWADISAIQIDGQGA
ncbi:MAG: peroxidase-related enzyme [Anaerolineales bacterium]|nr:peroxidase-related enzyme [Anaerolineales bacterium]